MHNIAENLGAIQSRTWTRLMLHELLEMSPDEQRRRMSRMREQVAYNNVFRWAGKFLSALLRFDLPENGQDSVLD